MLNTELGRQVVDNATLAATCSAILQSGVLDETNAAMVCMPASGLTVDAYASAPVCNRSNLRSSLGSSCCSPAAPPDNAHMDVSVPPPEHLAQMHSMQYIHAHAKRLACCSSTNQPTTQPRQVQGDCNASWATLEEPFPGPISPLQRPTPPCNPPVIRHKFRSLSNQLGLPARHGPPLFYTWPEGGGRGDPYLGAAHGLVGIVHALLHCWWVDYQTGHQRS